jgi:hypothetical protein
MPRPYAFTEKKFEQWTRDGRGTGEGESWIPWLQRLDFSSSGKVTQDSLIGNNGREVHLFSELERLAWKTYSCKLAVLGIEEQRPHDREVTRRLAREMGIEHPRDPNSHVDIVVTTDLVIRVTAADGKVKRLARSVKPANRLANHNQMEHAELERRVCTLQGMEFGFLSESSFPEQLTRNIDMLYMHRNEHTLLEPLGYEGSFEYVASEVVGAITSAKTDRPLFSFCAELNERMGWPSGLASRVAINRIRWHELRADYVSAPLGQQSVLAIALATVSRRARPILGNAA